MSPRTVAVLLSAPAALAAQDVLPADWGQRDLEGRWVAYRAATAPDDVAPEVRVAWLEELGRRRELDLLEWIAIYEPRRGGAKTTPLSVLVAAGAPHWLRVALWQFPRHVDSHAQDEAERVLLAHKAETWSFLLAHGLDEDPGLARLVQALRAAPPERVPVESLLPPLDPEPLVLAWLDAPPGLVEFGGRRRAERGDRYVHQVLRAIDGLVQGSLFDEPYPTKLYALTEHDLRAVREHAFLALASLPPRAVPHAKLDERLARTRDPAERNLVVMALARSDHPAVVWRLLDLLSRTDEPARDAATQRLADVADPFVARRLAGEAEVDEDLVSVASRAAQRVDGRLRDPRQLAVDLPTWLERVAWARVASDPRAGAAANALRDALRATSGDSAKLTTDLLDRIGRGVPAREGLGARSEAVAAAVAELARQLGEGRR